MEPRLNYGKVLFEGRWAFYALNRYSANSRLEPYQTPLDELTWSARKSSQVRWPTARSRARFRQP